MDVPTSNPGFTVEHPLRSSPGGKPPKVIILTDGSKRDIAPIPPKELAQLFWDEERTWATMIKKTAKGSQERADVTRVAYDSIATIVTQLQHPEGGPVTLGLSSRSIRLALRMLNGRKAAGVASPKLFEIGYGTGGLLAAISEKGFDVGGIEVSQYLHDQAKARINAKYHKHLHMGDFVTSPLDGPDTAYDVVWWNDVLEHVPVDSAQDFFHRAYKIIRPGGALITLTPNWHVRPSDVTRSHMPPRSEAVGFHLKEYTMREVRDMLKSAGFSRVTMPLITTRNRAFMVGSGLCGVKCFFEPVLEHLPFKVTKVLCGGFAMNCTIGWKK